MSRGGHAGPAGPFAFMGTEEGRRAACTEVRSDSRLHTERARGRGPEAACGTLRAQALTPQESLALVEKLLLPVPLSRVGPDPTVDRKCTRL
ncbi:Scr1 family TA system antitoxin-like transcriptional regulator [Streptomyces sp. NPDC057433]|uniref:Scr1 family TA system antitoxin-like transcriptional regulator n=1 Tax=Streptomyces sp. NPDC057433 TaxID=3346132 RepID=UPI0036B67056